MLERDPDLCKRVSQILWEDSSKKILIIRIEESLNRQIKNKRYRLKFNFEIYRKGNNGWKNYFT